MKLTKMPYKIVKSLIQEGDVLLFRGNSWVSYFVGKAGETTYSHVGLASWVNGQHSNAILEVIEFQGGVGGRSINLDQLIKTHSGQIDVYRPIPSWSKWKFNLHNYEVVLERHTFNGKLVTKTMRKLTGLPYGWKRIWWLAKRKLAGFRIFYSAKDLMVDKVKDVVYPICSTTVAYSFNVNGYDLTNNRSDEWTEPGTIAESTRLSYLFTPYI